MPDPSRPGSTTTMHPTARLQDGDDKIRSKNNHQAAKRRNNRNMDCPLSRRLQQSTGAYPWVKVLSMGHPGPCWGQMDRFWWNYHRWGTQNLVLRVRLITPVWVALIVRKRKHHQLHSHLQHSSPWKVSFQISVRSENITVIQVHVPTSDHEDKKVERFYERLDSIIAKTPKKDTCSSRWLDEGHKIWYRELT